MQNHSFQNDLNNVYASIRGEVFDLLIVANPHLSGQCCSDAEYAQDIWKDESGFDLPYPAHSDSNTQYHDFRVNKADYRLDWYFEQMVKVCYSARVGFLGFKPNNVKNMASQGKSVAIYSNKGMDGLRRDELCHGWCFGPNFNPPAIEDDNERDFMHSSVVDLFKFKAGVILQKIWMVLEGGLGMMCWIVREPPACG
ncbi:hypothetical protein VKT23_008703 [Stygiomarasmius scandens]|uniref:Uncharacterized protein n=1 Tax=Marasmiellus scandens TaxID=2682957 RepID=A0ABR1JNB7_9AGAR